MKCPHLVVGSLALAASQCQPPTFFDANAANPPEGLEWPFTTEVHGIFTVSSGEPRVLLSYIDQTGGYDVSQTGQAIPKSHPSVAGLSISHDAGINWQRVGPIPAADVNCGQPLCAVELLGGDPWIAQSGTRILYSELATKVSPGNLPGVAVMASDNGGDSWSAWRVAVTRDDVDKPSLSMLGSTATVVYRSTGVLYGAISDSRGDIWYSDAFLPTADAGQVDDHDPIVALTNQGFLNLGSNIATEGFVAHISRNGTSSSPGIYSVRIIRIVRTSQFSTTWGVAAAEVFRDGDFAIDPAPVGWSARPWRDDIPMRFAVAGRHLYITYRLNIGGGSKSVIRLGDCVDMPFGRCVTGSNAWRVRDFQSSRSPGGDRFQPDVAAAGNLVALTFYERFTNDAEAYDRVGMFSEDNGDTFHGPSVGTLFNLRPEGGNAEPCVFRDLVNPQNPGFFGDYSVSVIVPTMRYQVAPGQTFPWIVSAFADSKAGCADFGVFTRDQHVRATVW